MAFLRAYSIGPEEVEEGPSEGKERGREDEWDRSPLPTHGHGGGEGGGSPLLKVKPRIPPPEKDFMTPPFAGKIIFIDPPFEFTGKIKIFKMKTWIFLFFVTRTRKFSSLQKNQSLFIEMKKNCVFEAVLSTCPPPPSPLLQHKSLPPPWKENLNPPSCR